MFQTAFLLCKRVVDKTSRKTPNSNSLLCSYIYLKNTCMVHFFTYFKLAALTILDVKPSLFCPHLYYKVIWHSGIWL